ncbi:MAG TPA: hypothetical protein VNA24_28755 [Hyalangium sp.]|nr:hypothetical protein [Hyalangium sp.]
MEKIPGPMLGPFDSDGDALIAACNKIFSKPHASAGRKDHPQFEVRWRVSNEYCAWMYYTPDDKYVISKLTDQTHVDPALRSKHCVLPPNVEDPRYPPDSLKYIFALHNHLYDDRISNLDINWIVNRGLEHGFEAETRHGKARLSIVAFLANDFEHPACDGFYQYIPATHQILKWTHEQGKWECWQTHVVAWRDGYERFAVEEANRPCPKRKSP